MRACAYTLITRVGTCVGSHNITYAGTQSRHHEAPFPLCLPLGRLCRYPQVPAGIVSSQAARYLQEFLASVSTLQLSHPCR